MCKNGLVKSLDKQSTGQFSNAGFNNKKEKEPRTKLANQNKNISLYLAFHDL